MDQEELRRRLKSILDAEDSENWDRVDQLSDELNRELMGQNFESSPEIVNHYLDDADVRAQSKRYAETQRRQVRRFVESGDYRDSTAIPLWLCGLIAAIAVAAVIWLLK